ncbi:MAG: hypothetical protein KDD53_04670, partial [Bdellovibrionales bacterium]|nr:hypothetical protein [Bdellovibrionales bacterium]
MGFHKKAKHLELVSGSELSGSGPEAQGIITLEKLSRIELLGAERALKRSGISAAMVGVLKGSAAWDIRPVIIQEGELRLLRLTSPEWVIQDDKLLAVRASYHELTRHFGKNSGLLSAGLAEGRLWVYRRFAPETLLSADNKAKALPSFHPIELCQSLILILEKQFKLGIVHGHISLSNLLLVHGELVLVDHLFASLEGGKEDLAPEFRDPNILPNTASDMFGLGQVMQELLGARASVQQRQIISALLEVDPTRRPTLEEVQAVFHTRSVRVLEESDALNDSAPDRTGRGKVINARLRSLDRNESEPELAKPNPNHSNNEAPEETNTTPVAPGRLEEMV